MGKGRRSAIGRATVPCQWYMTQQALDQLQKALSLSEEEQAELASSLLDSLDATVDEGPRTHGARRSPAACGHRLRKSKDGSMGRGSKKVFVQTHHDKQGRRVSRRG